LRHVSLHRDAARCATGQIRREFFSKPTQSNSTISLRSCDGCPVHAARMQFRTFTSEAPVPADEDRDFLFSLSHIALRADSRNQVVPRFGFRARFFSSTASCGDQPGSSGCHSAVKGPSRLPRRYARTNLRYSMPAITQIPRGHDFGISVADAGFRVKNTNSFTFGLCPPRLTVACCVLPAIIAQSAGFFAVFIE
jgi:hypothetical protein